MQVFLITDIEVDFSLMFLMINAVSQVLPMSVANSSGLRALFLLLDFRILAFVAPTLRLCVIC